MKYLYISQTGPNTYRMTRQPMSPGEEWIELPREPENKEYVSIEDGKVVYTKHKPPIPSYDQKITEIINHAELVLLLMDVADNKLGVWDKIDLLKQQIKDIEDEDAQ